MYTETNDNNEIDVYAFESDRCSTCLNARDCPLIIALQTNVVSINCEDIEIQECKLYKQ